MLKGRVSKKLNQLNGRIRESKKNALFVITELMFDILRIDGFSPNLIQSKYWLAKQLTLVIQISYPETQSWKHATDLTTTIKWIILYRSSNYLVILIRNRWLIK